jgi:hypothetical protein
MERFGWTEKQLLTENSRERIEEIIVQLDCEAKAQRMQAEKDKMLARQHSRRGR